VRRVGEVLRASGISADVQMAVAAKATLRRWREVVGPALADQSWPDRYGKGTVYVAVRTSTWAQELRMLKPVILERLREMAGPHVVFTQVRFGVRRLPAEATPGPKMDIATDVTESAPPLGSIAERKAWRLANWKGAREL